MGRCVTSNSYLDFGGDLNHDCRYNKFFQEFLPFWYMSNDNVELFSDLGGGLCCMSTLSLFSLYVLFSVIALFSWLRKMRKIKNLEIVRELLFEMQPLSFCNYESKLRWFACIERKDDVDLVKSVWQWRLMERDRGILGGYKELGPVQRRCTV